MIKQDITITDKRVFAAGRQPINKYRKSVNTQAASYMVTNLCKEWKFIISIRKWFTHSYSSWNDRVVT